MHMKLLAGVAIAVMASIGEAQAAGAYLGQSGQYHLIPQGQDVQKITLHGTYNGPCGPNRMTLHAVDEFGTTESIPFVVPSQTVFLLTDAAFTGVNNAGNSVSGDNPWLNIGQLNANYSKASFVGSPLLNGTIQRFAGQGSLASGVAFATGSTLCAQVTIGADDSFGVYNMPLNTLVVYGTVVDNTRSNGFSW